MKKYLFKKIFFVFITINFFTPIYADEKLILGLEVFNNKAQCGVCHTLKAARSNGDIGPNLDKLKPSLERIIYSVKNGIGVMQSWEGILTSDEIEAVAYYVFKNTN